MTSDSRGQIFLCLKCLLPSTKPDLSFNTEGVCSACTAYENRSKIDWVKRENEFHSRMSYLAKGNLSGWDCVIPVSGGKDSTYQVLKMIEMGYKPLCVTATTCDLTDIGRRNIENVKNLGIDYIEVTSNPKIRTQLNSIGLRTVGDISWPEHLSIFTIPVRVAVQFRIPTIIWGENSQNEYGGPTASQESSVLNRRWLEEFGGLLGLRVSDLSSSFGISQKDLNLYTYPSDEELSKVGVTGIFLGHYFTWDGITNFIISQANGFESLGRSIEGSMVDYENLDNYQSGIHDYFKFLKFGFGRATDLASILIRRGLLTRDQGISIVNSRDGMYPNSYLGKPLEKILEKIEISISEFELICDQFTNTEIFETNLDGNLMKDSNGRPIKKKPLNG
jgi:N-acetyl sugar amidotransferase